MPVIEASRKMENTLGVGGSYWAFGLYEFALDGGAVGDIALRGAPVIPSGAVIINALIYVDTVPTSGGAATIAIKTEGAADINAADAISGAPWSSTGAKRGDFDAAMAVTFAIWGTYAALLVLRHEGNLLTVYANIDGITVSKGDRVKRGQAIAKVRAGDKPFLHFEVRQGFDSVDPMPYLQ